MPSPDRTRPTGPRVLPGAVSPLTADLVHGRPRRCAVLAGSRVGAYLGAPGRVLPVLGHGAVALPGALRVAGPLDLSGLRPGDPVTVGDGEVVLPGVVVRGARTWRPARVGAAPAPRARGSAGVRQALVAATAASPSWLADGVRAALTTPDPGPAVRSLVGRGPGLTPSGDDALAGALLLRRALAADEATLATPLARAVRARLHATTAVSAALLEAALDGWAAPEAVALVAAVAADDADALTTALPAALAVGHTSGRDLVTGVVAALAVLHPSGRIAA